MENNNNEKQTKHRLVHRQVLKCRLEKLHTLEFMYRIRLQSGINNKNHSDDSKFSVVLKTHDENSISRQRKAALLPKETKQDFLSLLGDMDDPKYPIYMTGIYQIFMT